MRPPSSRIVAAEFGQRTRLAYNASPARTCGVSAETVFSDDEDRRAMKVQREARDDETSSPARETRALPRNSANYSPGLADGEAWAPAGGAPGGGAAADCAAISARSFNQAS